jgi:hypothetical protein
MPNAISEKFQRSSLRKNPFRWIGHIGHRKLSRDVRLNFAHWWWFSITASLYLFEAMAAASPAGPPPATKTSVSHRVDRTPAMLARSLLGAFLTSPMCWDRNFRKALAIFVHTLALMAIKGSLFCGKEKFCASADRSMA